MPPALYKKEEVPEKFYFEGPSRELFLSDFNFRFAQISESAFSYEKISTLPISDGLKIEDTDTEPQ